jgi:transposase-like protein
MDDVNFCPFCDAPQHKISMCNEAMYFCRECNRFFELSLSKLQCPRCKSHQITKSDFPSPSGEFIFQCKDCKKMFPSKEFFAFNKIK